MQITTPTSRTSFYTSSTYGGAASSTTSVTSTTYGTVVPDANDTSLLLSDEGFSSSSGLSGTSTSGSDINSTGSSFDPAAASNSSASELFNDLNYTPTLTMASPGVPALGSSFNPAAVSETGDTELFAYEGFPAAQASSSLFGASSASTTATDHGLGQYSSVATLLNASTSSDAMNASTLEGVSLSELA